MGPLEVGRAYSAEEVARHVVEHGEDDYEACLHLVLTMAPRWRLARVPVAALSSMYSGCDDDPAVARYLELRRAGSPFPALVVDVLYTTPADGNHRVAAAELAGDEFIDSFVPDPDCEHGCEGLGRCACVLAHEIARVRTRAHARDRARHGLLRDLLVSAGHSALYLACTGAALVPFGLVLLELALDAGLRARPAASPAAGGRRPRRPPIET